MDLKMKLAIKDESFAGKVLNEIYIEFNRETVTVKDIIEARVIKEVEEYNKKSSEYFNGLVEPTDAEKTLNGYKLKTKRIIDAEKQIYIALEAFQKNGYFVLIDTIQSESLEQELDRICTRVQHGLQSVIPAEKLEAVYLGGGYGRGEGGVMKTNSGDLPYNDMEFWVFLRGNRLLNERMFRDALHHLGEELTPDAGIEVEFKIASAEKLNRARTMFAYDLAMGHRRVVTTWRLCDSSSNRHVEVARTRGIVLSPPP
jgi:hypothetical protein